MKRQAILLIASIFILLCLVSCQTVNAYVDDTSSTTLTDMKVGRVINGKRSCTWQNYSLELRPNKKASKSSGTLILGWGDVSSVFVKDGILKQNGKDLFKITVIKDTEESHKNIVVKTVNTIESYEMQIGDYEPFEFSEIKNYKTDCFIDTTIAEENLSIKIKAIMQYKTSKDKVYDYTRPTGFQIYVNEEEFALIDSYSGKDFIYLNDEVNNKLTQKQKDLASGIMLGFYLTYLENPEIRNSSETMITTSDSTSLFTVIH